MHWSASAPVTWPGDAAWQAAWRTAVDEAARTTSVRADGTVAVEGAAPADPRIELTAGEHLRAGAAYRIAPELTTGVLRGWVATGRAAGVEWAPRDEPGRAHVEVQSLDRFREVRGESTLRYVTGRGRLALDDPAHLVDVEVALDWARLSLTAEVRRGRLEVDLRITGRGTWRPVLAGALRAASRSIGEELERSVAETAEAITRLPVTGTLELGGRVEALADRQRRHGRELRTGMGELARRQRQVLDVVDALPWWRRSSARWLAETAALPPGSWPPDEALTFGTWPDRERAVATLVAAVRRGRRAERLDAVVREYGETLVADKLAQDQHVDDLAHAPRTEPWLTDATTDLSWLASPWAGLKKARAGVS